MVTPMIGPPIQALRQRASTVIVDDLRALSSNVRPALLRGVRADIALRRFSAVFKTGGIGIVGSQGEYETSHEVDFLDIFVSHDWSTGRMLKHLTLCIVFNFEAASVASVLFGALLSLFQFDFAPQLLPTTKEEVGGRSYHRAISLRSQLGCPVAFIFVFLFWQQIKQYLGLRISHLFLDKLCINQTNEELKAEAILGLAGFLKCSHRLLVLWSPRYFTRLWCTYEVASWLHLGKDLDTSIIFAPVPLTSFLIYSTIFSWSVLHWTTIFSFVASEFYRGSFVMFVLLNLVVFTSVAIIIVYFAFGILRDLHEIHAQLSQFSIRNSQCFCCQHQHTHPVTKQKVPCDRKLVYLTLKGWSFDGGEEDVPEKHRWPEYEVDGVHLDAFNNIVRTAVAERLSHSGISMGYVRALMPGLPYAWKMMDIARHLVDDAGDPAPFPSILRCCCSFIIWFVAIIPCTMWLVFHIGKWLTETMTDSNHGIHRAKIALKGTVIGGLVQMPFTACFEYSCRLENWHHQFILSFAYLACTVIIFNENIAQLLQLKLTFERHRTHLNTRFVAGPVETEMAPCGGS